MLDDVRGRIARRLAWWGMRRIEHYKQEIRAGKLTATQATTRFEREFGVLRWLAGMGKEVTSHGER